GNGQPVVMGLTDERRPEYFLFQLESDDKWELMWREKSNQEAKANLPVVAFGGRAELLIAATVKGIAPTGQKVGDTPAFLASYAPPALPPIPTRIAMCPNQGVYLYAHLPKGQPFRWLKDGRMLSTNRARKFLVKEPGQYKLEAYTKNCEASSAIIQVYQDCPEGVAAAPPPKPPKPEPVVTTEAPVEPSLKRTRSGMPTRIRDRGVKKQGTVTVTSTEVEIYVWDRGAVDQDTISLNVNGQWLLTEFPITHKRKKLTVQLTRGTTNFIILYAHNLGRLPPNTASIMVDDGNSQQALHLKSTLGNCGMLNLKLE
ncbi:MAG: hypothetical protein AAGI38_09565, partial [Bacteroidota bacterium]